VRLSDDERAALSAAAAADNREAASLARLYILAALKAGGFLK
jgi:hypothetical protein